MSRPDSSTLHARYGEEQVLVLPAIAVKALPTGVCDACNLDELLAESCYLPRWQAEYNPAWRQLVSYIVLQQADQLFLTERLSSQSETRLHSLYSVGVGGHINQQDGCDPVAAGWQRELAEELSLNWSIERLSPKAVINDLSNAVSQDHLGLLYLVEVPPTGIVRIREEDKMRGRLLKIKQIKSAHYDQLETWSQLVIDWLEKAQR